METTQQAGMFSAVRSVLAVIGGYVVGKGWASAELVTQLIGVVLAIIPLVWGVWDKYQTAKKMTTAVNVGIAVADRTHGLTPPVPAAVTPAVIEAFTPVAPVAPEGSEEGPKVGPASPVLPPGPAKPSK